MDTKLLIFIFVVFIIFTSRDKTQQVNPQQHLHSQPTFNGQGQPIYVVNQAPYPPYGKAIGKWAYFLIVFFLGHFGVHKFIAGKWFQGILYLLLVWTGIPSIFAFFHLIGVLFRRPDQYGNIYI